MPAETALDAASEIVGKVCPPVEVQGRAVADVAVDIEAETSRKTLIEVNVCRHAPIVIAETYRFGDPLVPKGGNTCIDIRSP